MTKIIGLTGGIGSGKTTIANYIKSLGIPVYFADVESKRILDYPKTQELIKLAFGEGVFNHDKINREILADLVFNDRQKLNQLNDILHPMVSVHFRAWLKNHLKASVVVKEAAILFESGSYLACDYIITVVAPFESRVERVKQRDGISRDSILARINNQWSDAQRIEKSDFIIQNSDLQDAKAQVDEIIKKLIIL